MASENEIIQHTDGRTWTVAHVKPRCEKVVSSYCDAHFIPHYLPLRRRAKRYQRRLVETFLPMFPGYVFVQLDSQLQSALMKSNRVTHVLHVNPAMEKGLIVELNSLRRFEELQFEHEIEVCPELVPGVEVVVCDGPMKGVKGVVERRNDGVNIVVNIELLGQSVSALIDSGDLELEA